MDLPRQLGLAVLAGIDADGIASIRASLQHLAEHPTDGAPALTFLTELDERLGLVHAVLSDPGGAQLIALAARLSSNDLPFSESMVAAAAILRPPQR